MPEAVGIDIGGTKILGVRVALSDPTTVLAEEKVGVDRRGDVTLDSIAAMATMLADGPCPVGVGIAGLVNRESVLCDSPHLPGLRGVNIRDEVARRLEGPRHVHVLNDASCAAWAEHVVGAARRYDEVACITLGTGIGAGFVSGGRLQQGRHGFAGEPGHMVVDRFGPPCACGRNGCWEKYASGNGLARLGRDAAAAGRLQRPMELAGGLAHQVSGEHIAHAAREGDPGALAVLDDFAGWVAVGLGNVVTINDLHAVVLSGGLVDLGDLLLRPVERAFQADVMCAAERSDVKILLAELGSRAGAIGAAILGGMPARALA